MSWSYFCTFPWSSVPPTLPFTSHCQPTGRRNMFIPRSFEKCCICPMPSTPPRLERGGEALGTRHSPWLVLGNSYGRLGCTEGAYRDGASEIETGDVRAH